MNWRKLKKKILELLSGRDFEKNLEEICRIPARQAVNPLISFFYSGDERLKWRAIAAMGQVVSGLACQDMESARLIMRRLLWNLNDESGGIGWGSPEAMGEIMAHSEKLADEYSRMLISYINPDGNYLEHELLQRGSLWGVGRLAHARPDHAKDAAEYLPPFLKNQDPILRGLAAWAAIPIKSDTIKPVIKQLIDDKTKIRIFIDMDFVEFTTGQLARKSV
ncbi:HEAT repeat domain-containing protein [Desulfobacterales bacterium HSG16]|nr:HEAT repeat domain-containing protein [Desulfobacterales bacterium HSG16]